MSNSQKRITIAIPSYNQPQHLEECLKSIEQQTFVDKIETIVFNDPSPLDAEIRNVVEKFSHLNITFLTNKERLGANDNIQQAVHYSYTTPYVMIFHHDDTMAPQYVETCITLLDNHTGAAWVSSNFSFRKKGEEMQKFPAITPVRYEVYHNQADIVRAILKNRNISFGSTTYRVDIVKELFFDFNRFAQNSDRPAVIDIVGDKMALFIKQPLVNYRLHFGQDSKTNRALTPTHSRALMAFYKSHLPHPFSGFDRRLFLRFSTNNLLDSYWRLVDPGENFITYVEKARNEGLLNFWYVRRAGIRALWRFIMMRIKI